MTLILKIAAFFALVLFLGVLMWKVPRLDLGVAIGMTLLLGYADIVKPISF